MKNIKRFETYILEKEIIKDNIKDTKDLNKGYNWNTSIPSDQDKDTDDKWYRFVNKSEIGIGDSDPVKKFKEWNGKYWRTNKTKDLKDEPRKEKGEKSFD